MFDRSASNSHSARNLIPGRDSRATAAMLGSTTELAKMREVFVGSSESPIPVASTDTLKLYRKALNFARAGELPYDLVESCVRFGIKRAPFAPDLNVLMKAAVTHSCFNVELTEPTVKLIESLPSTLPLDPEALRPWKERLISTRNIHLRRLLSVLLNTPAQLNHELAQELFAALFHHVVTTDTKVDRARQLNMVNFLGTGREPVDDPVFELAQNKQLLFQCAQVVNLGSPILMTSFLGRGKGIRCDEFQKLTVNNRQLALSLYLSVGLDGSKGMEKLGEQHARCAARDEFIAMLGSLWLAKASGFGSGKCFEPYLNVVRAKAGEALDDLIKQGLTKDLIVKYRVFRYLDLVTPEYKQRFEQEVLKRLNGIGRNSATTADDILILTELVARDRDCDEAFKLRVLQRADSQLKGFDDRYALISLAFWLLTIDFHRREHVYQILSKRAARIPALSDEVPELARQALILGVGFNIPSLVDLAVNQSQRLGWPSDGDNKPHTTAWLKDAVAGLEIALPPRTSIQPYPFGIAEIQSERNVHLVCLPTPPAWHSELPQAGPFRSLGECECRVVQAIGHSTLSAVALREPIDGTELPLTEQFRTAVLKFLYPVDEHSDGQEPNLISFE